MEIRRTAAPLSDQALRRHLPARLSHLPVLVRGEVTSTNTLAREAAQAGAAHGTVIAAASQTAGRGRRGRSFCSPAGTGLYVSVVLRPAMDASRAIRITTAAAVALCRALERMGVTDTAIKWVNDVFRGGRKIAGILTEASFSAGDRMEYAILGVGVNVSPPPGGFAPEIAEIAGAALEAPVPEGRERLLALFLDEFFALYEEMGSADAAHMEEYRRRCFVIGRAVTVLAAGGGRSYEATAVGIDEECGLIVRLPDGRKEVLASGEVSLRIP